MSATVSGLPERLPEGERLLWQGRPDWRVLARRVFHLRPLALYFGAILAFSGLNVRPPRHAGDRGPARTALLIAGWSLVPFALVTLYAWGIGRSTVYTVTTEAGGDALRRGAADDGEPALRPHRRRRVPPGAGRLRRHRAATGAGREARLPADVAACPSLAPGRAEPMLRGLP